MAPAAKKAKANASPAGPGLAKFFNKVQAPKDEAATQAVAAPEATKDEAVTQAVAAPAVQPPPAASPPAPPQQAGAAKALTDEQLKRITENKQRALELRRLKQAADGSANDDAASRIAPATVVQAPVAPTAPVAPLPATTGTITPKRGATNAASKTSPKPPPTPPVRAPTKRKAEPPTPEKPDPPPKAAATAPDGGAIRPAERFAGIAGMPWLQYNDLYNVRLGKLRDRVLDEARALWAGSVASHAFARAGEPQTVANLNEQTVIVGVVFKCMPSRPNVIEQYKEHSSASQASQDVDQIFCSDADTLWLEDRGCGRVRLDMPPGGVDNLVTGLVCAMKGAWTEARTFTVKAWCFAKSAPSPPALPAPKDSAAYVALVSGLRFGDDTLDAATRDRAVEFLLAAASSSGSALLAGTVQRLIVCGDSVNADTTAKSKDEITAALAEADACFDKLAAAMPVDVMPGRTDPSNYSLPQDPLHPYLFKKVRERRSFKSVRNPYDATFDGLSILGTSGQPVRDMLRCSKVPTPLDALNLCFEASHLAPTAPDTLPTHPFKEVDPFIISATPHLLFSGNHSCAAHQWQASRLGGDDERAGTQCVIVPAFHLQPSIILVNIMDPREVRIQNFANET